MTDLRVYFRDDKVGRTFSRSIQRQRDRVLATMRGTAQQARAEIEKNVRADIRKASPAFAASKRWAPGFTATVTEGGGSIRITARSSIPYFLIHQTGGVIKAKNPSGLLWIPLDFAKDAKGVMARDYPKKLFRVDRVGKSPLLLSDDGPKYFGIAQVTIPKRFHVFEEIRKVTNKFNDIYKKQFKGNLGVASRG